jgi:AraC-like DNA-binding protein
MASAEHVDRLRMKDLVPVPADLFRRVAALGVDIPDLVHRVGLSPAQSTFSTAEQMAFWRTLAEIAPRRDIGLRLGSEKTAEQRNLAELAASHAATVEEALHRIARYKRLVCAERVTVARQGDEASIQFRWVHARGPIPHLLVECVFAAVVKLVHDASGSALVPRRIELARRRADAALLEGHFGCAVAFDEPQDRLVLASEDLTRRFRPQRGEIYAELLPSLEAALADRTLTFPDEVRDVLRRHMVGDAVTIAQVARDLALTPRTLQRRLSKEGTSYHALLDEVRRDTALRLLDATSLTEGEIAFFLGFEELNSFTRAFRAWEGTTPRRWRTGRAA